MSRKKLLLGMKTEDFGKKRNLSGEKKKGI
jgi:hypothetical protein